VNIDIYVCVCVCVCSVYTVDNITKHSDLHNQKGRGRKNISLSLSLSLETTRTTDEVFSIKTCTKTARAQIRSSSIDQSNRGCACLQFLSVKVSKCQSVRVSVCFIFLISIFTHIIIL
jgi:hypothetical protein